MTTKAEAPALLRDPNLFARIQKAITDRGFAADPSPAVIAYVALTSRLLPRPLCLSFVAPSGAGKSEAVKIVLPLFPENAYVRIDASSERAFIYLDRNNEDSYRNRILIVGEADSLPDKSSASSALRSLISDGEMSYDVCEKTQDGGFMTNRIKKRGPTGFITTGIRSLSPQLSTRMLEITVSDSPDQTRAILHATNRRVSADASTEAVETSEFVTAQNWLEKHGDRVVVIPFATALADLMPVQQIRTRRDYAQLLTTISAVALLHQCQRERNPRGPIVATLEDYRIARRLLGPIFDVVAVEGLTKALRETIEQVPSDGTVSISELASKLSRSKSTVSERVKNGIRMGYLENDDPRPGHTGRVRRTSDLLPEDTSGLPTVEAVHKTWTRSESRSEQLSNDDRFVA